MGRGQAAARRQGVPLAMLVGPKGGKYHVTVKGTKVYASAPGTETHFSRAEMVKHVGGPGGRFHGTPVKDIKAVIAFDGSKKTAYKIIRQPGAGDGKPVYVRHDAAMQKSADKIFSQGAHLAKNIDKVRASIQHGMGSHDPLVRSNSIAARLIDLHVIRTGGGKSEGDTGSQGITSLQAKNIKAGPNGTVHIRFQGKSHMEWDVHVTDKRLAHELKKLSSGKAPGDRLFDTTPQALNNHLKSLGGKTPGTTLTVKVFRTYHATRIVALALAKGPKPKDAKEAKQFTEAALDKAAAFLGNSRAMCKKSYVDPRVIDSYMAKNR